MRFANCCTVLFGVLPALSATGAVVDLAPRDLYAPTQSYVTATVTRTHSQFSGLYTSGQTDSSKRLRVEETTVNLTAFNAGTTQFPYFLSVGISQIALDQELDNLTTTGMSDLQLGAGLWPYFNPQTGESFGLGMSATVPTGDYDTNSALNTGQNRHGYNVLARYRSRPFGDAWLDLMWQQNWVTDNPNYLGNRLKNSVSGALTIYGVKSLENFALVFVGYEKNWGGESFINGIQVNTGQENTRLHLGWRKPVLEKTELVIRSSQSIDTVSGYAQDHRLTMSINRRF